MKISDALNNLAVAVTGSGETEDITEERIAEIIQYIADNWPEGGGGGSYELPAASSGALGGVKLASAVANVSAADATAAGEAYDQATAQTAVTLANANKAAINELLAALRASGALSN